MLLRTKPAKFLAKRLATGVLPSYYWTLVDLRRTEAMTEDSLERLQLQRLKRTLIHAYNDVPYYRKCFTERGLHPDKLCQLADMQNYPLLDKQTLRDSLDSLVTSRIVRKLWPPVYTGGTTGTPLRLYRSISDYGRERAFLEYAYRMVGIDPFARTVYLRGPVDDARGRYHRASVLCRTLYLSSNNMEDDKLALYIRLMREYQPVVLYTLPSVATVLAEYMDCNHVAPIESIRHAFLPSENLYEFQTRLIERVFHCTIGTHYGHSEHTVFAACCPESPLYHVLPQYGYAELIDEDGRRMTKEGQWGEIVGTSFTNWICPLIRYRTGDFAVYTRERCRCGRNYPMWKTIRGREQSVAIAKNGGRVSVGPELLCTLHDKSYGEVRQFQIRQVKKGELEIHITPHRRDGFPKARDYFIRIFNEQFPGMFDVRVIARETAREGKNPEKHLYFVQGITSG
jgi:phenylacetate-CoA ligase